MTAPQFFIFAYVSFSSLLLLLSYEIFRLFILSTYIFISFCLVWFGSSRINRFFFLTHCVQADRSKWQKITERISKVMSKYYRISLFCILFDAHVQHHHHSVFAMRSTHSFVLTELESGIDYTHTASARASESHHTCTQNQLTL